MTLIKSKNIILIFIIIGFYLNSCDFLSTRNPEPPDKTRTKNKPPVSSDIVISNLSISFDEKNSDNYKACFADSSLGDNLNFHFKPSPNAAARYATIFKYWNISLERSYFSSLISTIPIDNKLSLEYSNNQYETTSSDSVVYVTNYLITAEHNISTLPKLFSGTMRLTIKPRQSGLWAITEWYDYELDSDSLKNSWSVLKAGFSN